MWEFASFIYFKLLLIADYLTWTELLIGQKQHISRQRVSLSGLLMGMFDKFFMFYGANNQANKSVIVGCSPNWNIYRPENVKNYC